MLEDPLVAVLIGGAIALVSSVAVTWLQGSFARRTRTRNTAQKALHELWRLFRAERDASESERLLGEGSSRGLAEAELQAVILPDRRTRDRLGGIVKLLRECDLPEMEELSGVRAARARQILCEHALDVLGTQLRGEKLPAVPAAIKKMQDVEGEALNIHAGGASASKAQPAEPLTRNPVRRKPRTTPPSSDPTSSDSGSG